MPMAPMRDRRARTGRIRLVALVSASVVAVVMSAGCGAFSDQDEQASTVEVDREGFEEGDVEGAVGDQLDVYGLQATVTSVERVDSYSELDSRGYIVATIEMHNPSSSSVDYDRSDWQLEKPDGTVSNTANVSNQPQLQDDTIVAGATIEGTLIYTAGDAEGQFAILFSPASEAPEDGLEVERGVWVFESSPGDAS